MCIWLARVVPAQVTRVRAAQSFQVSRGWFDCFKQCYVLCNVKLTGERASADQEKAETFTAQLSQLIEEKGCLPE